MAFSMDLPDVEEVKEEVKEQVEPPAETKKQLATVADSNTDELFNFDLGSLNDRRAIVSSIETFGSDIVTKSTQKNELLNVRLVDLSKMGGENGEVVSGLSKLQMQMKDLDPSAVDFAKKGPLGKLFNPIRNYFAKFEKADDVIAQTIVSLGKGKDILKRDNTTLEVEQLALRDLTKKLAQQIELGMQMDDAISAAIEKAKVENVDEERIKFIEEEVLFPLRQRVMDMQQMQTVNMQGIIAMEIVRRNNRELIRAVERAENVTVSALRIAVTVASALYNQKIVLEKVNAVNEATNKLISSTSKMLKEQGASIQQQAMESNVSVDTLRQAFADTFEALDSVSDYKSKALPQMKNTIAEFRSLAEEGEKRILKMEARNAELAVQGSDNN
ncbi:MAG: toxic anion resistance protein [Clostridia bacterium]|nr:toxic anion resistance protein [Clostridia bacterium]HCA55086.1 toxic anion resistance protein [Oscillospiraceae bacterium]